MNRKIIFRAYDKVRKEYLSAGKIFLAIQPGKNPADCVQYLDVLRDPNLYADRFVIEQFAGMVDKNGKEIYENDIVRFDDTPYNVYASPYIGQVVMSGGCWCVKRWDESFERYFYPKLYADDFADRKTEVLGNFHDNADLLKGGENE